MFNNVVLDVFIGLIFIFLLYSLLATILQELIASRFGLRGRMLQKALRRMLEDGDGSESKYSFVNYWKESADNIIRFFKPFGDNDTLLKKFYSHPSIKYLGEGKLFRKPSYLHAHNFSQTVIHLLRGEDYDGRTENESGLIRQALDGNTLGINPQTMKQLKMLFADARQDSFLFKHKLEDWFEETMDRTTGWYKKQTQVILIVIGFGLAWAFNVDTIAITKILMKDKKARKQIVQLAVARTKDYSSILDSVKSVSISKSQITARDTTSKITHDTTTYDTTTIITLRDRFLDSVRNNLQNDALEVQGILGLRGLAMKNDTLTCSLALRSMDSLINTNPGNKNELINIRKEMYEKCMSGIKERSPYQKSRGLMIVGWLITALAISLGAPFWFDLLNKFIKLRESGPKAANMSAIDSGAINNTGSNPVKDNTNTDIRG
jgi:hypothetical protein